MGSKKEQIGRHCPHCGAIITFDEYFCRACHKRLTDQQNFDAPSTAKPDTYIIEMRKLPVSVIVSAIFVGLGQFYNGDTLKGLCFNAAFLIIAFSDIAGPRRAILVIGLWIIAIFEAVLSAWRINSYKRPSCGTSCLLWIELAGLAALIALHLYTGLPNTAYLEKLFPAAYFSAL